MMHIVLHISVVVVVVVSNFGWTIKEQSPVESFLDCMSKNNIGASFFNGFYGRINLLRALANTENIMPKPQRPRPFPTRGIRGLRSLPHA